MPRATTSTGRRPRITAPGQTIDLSRASLARACSYSWRRRVFYFSLSSLVFLRVYKYEPLVPGRSSVVA